MKKTKIAGIPAEIRKIMNTHIHLARTTESESVAEANISVLMGYLGYAVVSGAISAVEHSEEWSSIRMIRDEREARRRAARMILDIISGELTGIFKRLEGLGLTVVGINFVRQPFRIKGVWRCTVIV